MVQPMGLSPSACGATIRLNPSSYLTGVFLCAKIIQALMPLQQLNEFPLYVLVRVLSFLIKHAKCLPFLQRFHTLLPVFIYCWMLLFGSSYYISVCLCTATRSLQYFLATVFEKHLMNVFHLANGQSTKCTYKYMFTNLQRVTVVIQFSFIYLEEHLKKCQNWSSRSRDILTFSLCSWFNRHKNGRISHNTTQQCFLSLALIY